MEEVNNKDINEPIVPDSIQTHPVWFRLCDQLTRYDKKSTYCQQRYKFLKVVQVICAALIPVTCLLSENYAKLSAAILGALITVLEAVQQLNQYSTLWFTYRATAERLKHEKYLFLSCAGAYKEMSEDGKIVVLAERLEEHISTEHANWFNECSAAATAKQGGVR